MAEALLQAEHLNVSVEDKQILFDIGLNIAPGETHVLMGPNGAGKSTLGYALMGSPRYKTTGSLLFKGEEIVGLPADQRAKKGMFLSFQEPLEVPGLSLESFLRSAVSERTGVKVRPWEFRKQMRKVMELLEISPEITPQDYPLRDMCGPGYAIASEAGNAAVLLVAAREGIFLDPVYTGKAFAGLLELAKEGAFAETDNILFLPSGGAGGLFAIKM